MVQLLPLLITSLIYTTSMVSAAPRPLSTKEAERIRAEGITDKTIFARLTNPLTIRPFIPLRDGDIAPGSLPAPEMLPQPGKQPRSVSTTIHDVLSVMFGGERRDLVVDGTAYEGREREVRRPKGSRFWG